MTEPLHVIDLNPVDRITTDAIGEPGSRAFYIQARKGARLVTLLCEKEHVAGLALAIDQVLLTLADDDPDAVVDPDPVILGGMGLESPIEPLFRVGQVNLGYDQVTERLIIIAYELQDEDDPRPPTVTRLWATQAQMRSFSIHGQNVVAAGRSRCTMCGEPMDPEGHFCLRKNGHKS